MLQDHMAASRICIVPNHTASLVGNIVNQTIVVKSYSSWVKALYWAQPGYLKGQPF